MGETPQGVSVNFNLTKKKMKAELIRSETYNEIILENGEAYRSKKNESADDFWVRIAAKVDEEYADIIELDREISYDQLKKQDGESLKKRLETSNIGALETEIITEILVERGEMEKPEKKETKPDNGRKKGEREAPIGEPLPEETRAGLEENKGKKVYFIPRQGDQEIEGTIRGIMFDKRVGRAYYRILDENKRVYHKRVTSKDLRFE